MAVFTCSPTSLGITFLSDKHKLCSLSVPEANVKFCNIPQTTTFFPMYFSILCRWFCGFLRKSILEGYHLDKA